MPYLRFLYKQSSCIIPVVINVDQVSFSYDYGTKEFLLHDPGKFYYTSNIVKVYQDDMNILKMLDDIDVTMSKQCPQCSRYYTDGEYCRVDGAVLDKSQKFQLKDKKDESKVDSQSYDKDLDHSLIKLTLNWFDQKEKIGRNDSSEKKEFIKNAPLGLLFKLDDRSILYNTTSILSDHLSDIHIHRTRTLEDEVYYIDFREETFDCMVQPTIQEMKLFISIQKKLVENIMKKREII